jgi:MSHA pilin protein MshD
MTETKARATIPEEVMLGRLAQSEQMRAFFIQMWQQNPSLAKQGGQKVQSLLTPLECGATDELARGDSCTDKTKQRGTSLIELIMFIVIVSVALAGILLVMNVTTKSSADPLIHKQALAIAESLLEEVELMPFTYCDPDDANAASATSATVGAGGCAATVEAIGPEAGETRYSATTPFDNVNDYNGYDSTTDGGIKDITGNAVAALSGYSASIAVSASGLPNVTAGDSLLIVVTVTGPDGLPVVVEGMRTRYAPRTTP